MMSSDEATMTERYGIKIALTPREREIMQWLKCGRSTSEIAVILKISTRTVKYHIGNTINKLDAENRLHALAIAIERNLLS
jgi:DNA-binding CsgD family transcriptional regulator